MGSNTRDSGPGSIQASPATRRHRDNIRKHKGEHEPGLHEYTPGRQSDADWDSPLLECHKNKYMALARRQAGHGFPNDRALRPVVIDDTHGVAGRV